MQMMSKASFSQMPKDRLLSKIRQAQFSMHDLGLYLDTHAGDETAMQHYAMHKSELDAAIAAYTERFGALRCADTVNAPNGWAAWIKTPFPWEKED